MICENYTCIKTSPTFCTDKMRQNTSTWSHLGMVGECSRWIIIIIIVLSCKAQYIPQARCVPWQARREKRKDKTKNHKCDMINITLLNIHQNSPENQKSHLNNLLHKYEKQMICENYTCNKTSPTFCTDKMRQNRKKMITGCK